MSKTKEVAKIETVTLKAFKGLDLRHLPEATDPEAMLACSNVSVRPGGALEVRAPLRRVAVLDAASIGLYVVDGALRAALPYPNPAVRAVPRPPANFVYDLLTDSSNGFAGTLDELAAVTTWENHPYLSVSVTVPGGIRYRHYYPETSTAPLVGVVVSLVGAVLTLDVANPLILPGATVWMLGVTTPYIVQSVAGAAITLTVAPGLAGTPAMATFIQPTRNRVNLPFEPGSALLTAGGKVLAPDREGLFVWGSSTEFGPTDWTAADDAVAIPTSQHAGGGLPIQGLGIFNDKMVVFYERNAQLWTVDPFPDNIELSSVVGGAGTRHPGSVVNVQGDLFYFGDGTFRSMAAVVTTGQPKEGDQLGAPIAPRTKLISRAIRPAAVWSSRESRYICFFGAEAYPFTMSQVEGSIGWGRWDLPFEVSHVVEHNGVIYVRRADAPEVWCFDPATDDEDVDFSFQLGAVDCGAPGTFKRFAMIDVGMEGAASIEAGTNVANLAERTPVCTFTGSTVNQPRVPMLVTADHLLLRFSGQGPFRLDQLVLRYRQGGFA